MIDFDKMRRYNIIIYGNIRQMKDIQYVFEDLNICGSSEEIQEVLQYANKGYFVVLCKKSKMEIVKKLQDGMYCTDDELIETLNFSIKEHSGGKKIVIWGTGYYCGKFEEYIREKALEKCIHGYVDNNIEQIGKERNGLPIFSPKQINPYEFYVIVCVNYENYIEIQKDLKNIGFNTTGYVYFRKVMDNVADYFRQTYLCQNYYDIDCINKDNSVRIKANGDLCTCCMSYDSVYGNLFEEDFEDIWDSVRARISRLALENRTYVFCDKFRCPFLSNIPNKPRKTMSEEIHYKKCERKYPDSVAPEIDTSCNLFCTSCRNKVYIEKNSYIQCYTDMVLQKLVSLPVRFIINTVGEPFASPYCLQILTDQRTQKRENISIYSNGTLLYPEVLKNLLNHYSTIELAISVDAANKGTYDKLRRNGNFSVLKENLEFISLQRNAGRISFFQLNYVLQADNIAEMAQFISWAKALGVDRIAINAIEKWDIFTDEQYDKVSIIKDGKIKDKYKKYFTTDIINDELVNFFNIANIVGAKPKLMYMI